MKCIFLTRGDPPKSGFTLTLTGEYDVNCAYVTIGGTKYTSAQTIALEPGTAVSVYAKGVNKGSTITYNGTKVAEDGSYTFYISAPTTINMEYTGASPWVMVVTATITTS